MADGPHGSTPEPRYAAIKNYVLVGIIGAGLSKTEVGLRLRYEFVPELASYVGVAYERAFGNTATSLAPAGEKPGGWSLVTGVRIWF